MEASLVVKPIVASVFDGLHVDILSGTHTREYTAAPVIGDVCGEGR